MHKPSPLVGEGGEIERSEMEPGEGSVSADRDPSSGAVADAKHRRPNLIKQRWPTAAYAHLLPQGEKGKSGRRRRPLHRNFRLEVRDVAIDRGNRKNASPALVSQQAVL